MRAWLLPCLAASILSACIVGDGLDLEATTEDDFEDSNTTTIAFQGEASCSTMPAFTPTGIATSVNGKLAYIHFSEPDVAGTDKNNDANHGDERLLREAERLIWKTPSGATIRAAIHSLGVEYISKALACAQHRGVNVRVALDGDNKGRPGTVLLKSVPKLEVTVCKRGENRGCATTNPSGLLHSKLMTFSSTEAPDGTLHRNVSWVGSANMTFQTGAKTWNNTITIYDDAELKGGYDDYFGHLMNMRPLPQGPLYFSSSTSRVYASPSSVASNDIILNRLNDIKPGTGCEVRVAEGILSDKRMQLITKLKDLKEAGCMVKVIGNTNNTDDEVVSALKYPAKAARKVPFKKAPVHDKLIIVHARFGNIAGFSDIVFTGSHNFTVSANSKNDELLVRVDGRAVYDAYVGHFERIWAAAASYPGGG
jgi:hypothetical protein